jgi:hypothetical protein
MTRPASGDNPVQGDVQGEVHVACEDDLTVDGTNKRRQVLSDEGALGRWVATWQVRIGEPAVVSTPCQMYGQEAANIVSPERRAAGREQTEDSILQEG